MKKFLLLFLFLILFFAPKISAKADSMYDLDLPPNVSFEIPKYEEYKIKKGTSNEVKVNNPSSYSAPKKEEGGIKGFFNRLFNRNKKPEPQFDTVQSGYEGTLPNINKEFQYKKPKSTNVQKEGASADNYYPEEFQKSKIDDPLFLDVILKKENPSNYVVDMLRVMKFLESFRTVIENHENIQKFNANVNLLDLHARRIEKLYKDTPDGMSPSYWQLLDLSYKAKVLGNLKFDANYYSKFSPVMGTKYDPENILKEDMKLLSDLDKTIFTIRQLNY